MGCQPNTISLLDDGVIGSDISGYIGSALWGPKTPSKHLFFVSLEGGYMKFRKSQIQNVMDFHYKISSRRANIEKPMVVGFCA